MTWAREVYVVLGVVAVLVLGGATAAAHEGLFRDRPSCQRATTTRGGTGPREDGLTSVEHGAARKIDEQRAAWRADLTRCAARPGPARALLTSRPSVRSPGLGETGMPDRPGVDRPPAYLSRRTRRSNLEDDVKRSLLPLAAALAVAAGSLLGGSAVAAPSAATPLRPVPTPADAVLAWNTIAVNAALAAGTFQVQGLIYTSYVQGAVYDAVVAIEGRYRPYIGHLQGPRTASVDAAVEAAAHGVLVHRYPAQAASLDAQYTAALAGVPDGPRKAAGVRVGTAAAADLLAARAGDGVDADVTYTFGSGPGAWILPTDNTAAAFQTPQTPWVAVMRPFVIRRADQFRPGPPPALTSATYARDLNETQAYGSRTSTVRTPAQTETALFWTTNAIAADNATIRTLATAHHYDAARAARALAMSDMVESDALIACFDAKYHYGLWRPYTAIRGADTDGNPATTADPTWLPLVPTPNHPEYPAAHACGTGAQGDVLAALLGTRTIQTDITSAVTGTTRHYATVAALDANVVDARVWAGLHYRTSGLVGVHLADRVAREALEDHFQPTH